MQTYNVFEVPNELPADSRALVIRFRVISTLLVLLALFAIAFVH